MTAAEKKVAAAAAARDAAKAAKFVELAQKRATKAINAIRSLAKLSSANYIASDDQVTKLAETLRAEVVEMHKAFTATAPADKGGFEF